MHRDSLASVALLLASLALFASWIAPGHYHPWISFQNEVPAALGGILLAAAALLSPSAAVTWPTASRAVVAVALVPLIQFAAGQISFRSDALLSVLYILALAFAVSVGASLAQGQRKRFLNYVFAAFLAAGIVSAGMALTQWLNIGPIGWIEWTPAGVRPFANLGQPNHLASLLALSALAALWFYETRQFTGATLSSVMLWLTFAMALTRSRTLIVAVVLVSLAWLFVRRRFATRLKSAPLIVWLAFFVLLTALVGAMSEALSLVPPNSITERMQATSGRTKIWAALFDGLMQSPWVGYGWSQVSRAGLAGSLGHFTGESMLRSGHSFLLDLLLWNGIPIGMLLISLITVWWVRQLRRCDSAERAVVLGAVGAISVHCLFEFPLEYLYFLVPLGLMVGALESWSGRLPSPSKIQTAASFAALFGLFGIGLAITVEYLQVEQASRAGRMKAAGYNVTSESPHAVLLDEPLDYVRFWQTEAKPGMSPEELEWMERVAGRNPAPPTLLRYAVALGLNERPRESAQMLIRLCNMHTATRCDEGRQSWSQLKQNFNALQPIPYPPTPMSP